MKKQHIIKAPYVTFGLIWNMTFNVLETWNYYGYKLLDIENYYTCIHMPALKNHFIANSDKLAEISN